MFIGNAAAAAAAIRTILRITFYLTSKKPLADWTLVTWSGNLLNRTLFLPFPFWCSHSSTSVFRDHLPNRLLAFKSGAQHLLLGLIQTKTKAEPEANKSLTREQRKTIRNMASGCLLLLFCRALLLTRGPKIFQVCIVFACLTPDPKSQTRASDELSLRHIPDFLAI